MYAPIYVRSFLFSDWSLIIGEKETTERDRQADAVRSKKRMIDDSSIKKTDELVFDPN